MVQQLRECQLRGLDDGELFSVLAVERIRRTINLCMEVITDIDAGRVKNESKGVEELYRALEHLRDRIRPVQDPPASRPANDARQRKLTPVMPVARNSRHTH